MNISDVTIGMKVYVWGGAEEIGIVQRIDYDEYLVYVRFPAVRGVEQEVDVDPADLKIAEEGLTQ